MQTADKSGIICDKCGIVYKTEFKYYSLDFKPIEVYGNNKPNLQYLLSTATEESRDLCTACFDEIKKKVVEIYSKQMGAKHRPPAPYTICELSGVKLNGTYNYYYCVVSLVNVKIAGQPSYCINCKTQTFDRDKPCLKCSSKKFITPAKVTTDSRIVEFSVCEEVYKQFRKDAESVKAKQSNWTTRSE